MKGGQIRKEGSRRKQGDRYELRRGELVGKETRGQGEETRGRRTKGNGSERRRGG